MKTTTLPYWLSATAVLGLLPLLAWDVDAQTGPVKVTIQAEKNEASEAANLPIDPTPRVKYGLNETQMPGLSGINGERLSFSPQGGHEIKVHVDGQILVFGKPPGKWLSRNAALANDPSGRKRQGVQSVWVLDKVHITQTVEIVPSKAPLKGKPGGKRQMDVMVVRYTIENKDSKPHTVGIRNTMDILLIDNDGALFASPQTHKGKIVNGHEFKGDKVPDFVQVLQRPDLNNPGYVMHFTLKVGKLEPPTRFVCTNLGACFNGVWDVPALPAGDSAVGILFDPRPVAAGTKRDMAFAYGIGIASNPENEGRVAMHLNGSFEVGKQFTVTAYVDDPLASQSLTLELPAGLTRLDGKATQGVPGPSEGNSSVVLWKVRVDKVGDFAVKVRSSSGMTYNTQLKIEAAAQSELIRIEPKEGAKQVGPKS